eukprot:6685153-Prymnesium_polylepis.1
MDVDNVSGAAAVARCTVGIHTLGTTDGNAARARKLECVSGRRPHLDILAGEFRVDVCVEERAALFVVEHRAQRRLVAQELDLHISEHVEVLRARRGRRPRRVRLVGVRGDSVRGGARKWRW